jgi:hypothetical protein
MDPNEITEELEHPGARNVLESATLLRLAYNGSDGFPRVIPIGFYWNGNQIVVCTAATAPKVKALSSRPNVAMTIDVGDTPTAAKALLVRGLASVDIVTAFPTSTSRHRRRYWAQTRSRSSSARSGRCTSRWHVSPSSRHGRGSLTSVLAACRPS